MDYRIEDLARLTGTNVRNIRAYQERGLLSQPRKEGRFGFYDDAHLARLRVIGALLERGYSLGNIAELLETWETGNDLRELLGLEEALTSPFIDEVETTITVEEIEQLFGALDARSLELAVEFGLLIPGDTSFRVPSMRLLKAGAELHGAGVPLVALMEEHARLRADIDLIAARLVALARQHIFDRYEDAVPTPGETERAAEMVRRCRPLAEVVVDTELARALERHTRAVLGERLARLLQRNEPTRRSDGA